MRLGVNCTTCNLLADCFGYRSTGAFTRLSPNSCNPACRLCFAGERRVGAGELVLEQAVFHAVGTVVK